MSFDVPVPAEWRKAGWKAKIRDRERLEEPHVTILFKMRSWRVSLRTGRFLEKGQSWNQVPADVKRALEDNWAELVRQWDSKYPENPVKGESDDEDN